MEFQPALTPDEILSCAVRSQGTLEHLAGENQVVISLLFSITLKVEESALPARCKVAVTVPSVVTVASAGAVNASIGVATEVVARFRGGVVEV